MFCMNCGQQLPDGAKFCLNCGTPQGSVSPTETNSAKSNNADETPAFKPAMCPNCNAHMKVDPSCMLARCDTCGTECLVQDAIKALSSVTVKQDIQVGNATFNVSATNTEALLKRVELMLADGDFNGAMSKCDTILDSDPTNGKVYFFMLMADLKCRNRINLSRQWLPFDFNQYYLKAMQYGDDSLKSELVGYINAINARFDSNLNNLKVGDEFYYGMDNGKRMLWKVLSVQDGKALIITTDIVYKMPYHKPGGNITWSDCTLRNWLNSYFFDNYFSKKERTRILPSQINNDNNSEYKTPGGSPTTDNVFLLSIKDVADTFFYDPTIANGFWWWLRSPGSNPSEAALVSDLGRVNTRGGNVNRDLGVRPAMWIKLDS